MNKVQLYLTPALSLSVRVSCWHKSFAFSGLKDSPRSFFFSPKRFCLLWTYIPRICCGYKLQIDYTFNKCVNVALLANFSGRAGEGHGGMKDGILHWPQYITTKLENWHTHIHTREWYVCRREKFFRVLASCKFFKTLETQIHGYTTAHT